MADAKRDDNQITTLLAVSNVDGTTPVVLWADPTTHRLLVSSAVTSHNFLSSTHGDTVAASPVLGDIIYGDATPNWTKLAGNTTTTKKFLTQTGDGAISAVPAWATIAVSDIPDLSATYELAGAVATHAAIQTGVHGLAITSGKTLTVTNDATISGGSHSGTNTGDEAAASDTVAGIIEIATTAETDTGTDAARAVSPDGLAGSYAGTKNVQLVVFDFNTDTATGDGKFYFHIPASLDGMNLVAVHAEVITAGTTGTTDIQIHNVDNAVDMLSTKLTIDSGETGSDTAATPAVIDTANDHVNTNDVIRIDVDAVSTTPAKGLIISLDFRLP